MDYYIQSFDCDLVQFLCNLSKQKNFLIGI